MKIDVDESPVEERLDQSEWWKVTLISQYFAVRAKAGGEALTKVYDHIGVPAEFRDVAFGVHLADEGAQDDFTSRYEEREVVQLIPLSHEEWPDTLARELSTGQKEAMRVVAQMHNVSNMPDISPWVDQLDLEAAD